MDNLDETIDVIRDKMRIEEHARRRLGMASPGAANRGTRFREALKYYAPISNDQWPEDKLLRPSKVHITANIVRSYCDIGARLLSLPPRLINKPVAQTVENRKHAEEIEQFFYRLLDLSGWDVWMHEWALSGEIFGVGILKPFWNKQTGMPDVQVIEQPQNLLLGYGSNDYSVIDWAIYRYSVSFIEALSRWPDAVGHTDTGEPAVWGTAVNWATADKADIVNQRSGSTAEASGGTSDLTGQPSNSGHAEEYEQSHHIEVWDYWYRGEGDKIYNAVLVGGRIVDGPHEHPELPIVPYLVNQAGHEPGSPEGLSTALLLRDVQMGYNRAISLWTQYVLDNSGTAYQVRGPTAGDMPEGSVPRSDEFISVGENEIVPIQRNSNNYPINQLVDHYWQLASRLTGIPEILFGQLAGAQTSGRATAVQIEAALNRLDPKRRRFYQTFKDLLRLWGFMLEQKNIKVDVVESDQQQADPMQPDMAPPQMSIVSKSMKEMLKGFDNWKIIPPEITPRDSIEATQNAANKVGAHLSSIETAMDEIGIDDPLHELDLIRGELSDARLNPGQVQSYISAVQLLLSMAQQQQQQQAAAAGQQGQNTQQAQDQQAQPTGLNDQNQPGMATGPGGPPPPGAAAPGGMGLQLDGLIRQQGGTATAMNQVKLPPVSG